MGFPTKNDDFGVFWGYHHLRKHPYTVNTSCVKLLLSAYKKTPGISGKWTLATPNDPGLWSWKLFLQEFLGSDQTRCPPWNLTTNAPENRPKPPKGTLKVVAPNEIFRCELLVSGRVTSGCWSKFLPWHDVLLFFICFFAFDYPTIPLLVLDFSHNSTIAMQLRSSITPQCHTHPGSLT